MRTKILSILIVFTIYCNAQIVTIPDANFKAKLLSATTTNAVASGQIPYNSGGFPSVTVTSKIDTNNDGEIQVSEAALIRYLNVDSSNITSLEGISSFTNLQSLSLKDNQVSSLDVSALTSLKWLFCNHNLLTSINVSGLTNLYNFECEYNQLPNLNVQGLTSLQILKCKNNQLSSLNIQGTIINYLDCSYNQLGAINLQGLTTLRTFYCGSNQLTSLNLQGLTLLYELFCDNNLLTSLDLQNLNLNTLAFTHNSISQINVLGMTNLHALFCSYNQLSELDLHGLAALGTVDCSHNQLTTVNFQGLTELDLLYCNDNLLTEVDLQSAGGGGSNFYFDNNHLISMFVKNGWVTDNESFANNPNLQYICCDYNDFSIYNNEYNMIMNKLFQYGITNCQVNSYCSFTPEGTFYRITGNNKYDEDGDGCDASDPIMPNLKFNISSGSVSGSFINDSSGSTNFPVQAGTYTFSPALENPSYYTITPPSATVSFPTTSSPFNQDFCFLPNGTHPDLEVIILPMDPIIYISGTVRYKIIYKNKGNTTQSGSVNLLFNDPALDLIFSVPSINSQNTNNLTWNFSDLHPFETRSIDLEFNTFNPPLYAGGYLDYTATISSPAIDEAPDNNTMSIRQTGDVFCIYTYVSPIQGNTLPSDMVGRYTHYMVSAENTGTDTAQNIFIKDLIDTSKFDISTLQITDSSYPCVTKITASNKVEFMFENINLPAANNTNRNTVASVDNRVYVAFKIKTKPTLVAGDVINNSASIYFNYDSPTNTNNAQTLITDTLGLNENILTKVLVYPNPVKNILNIDTEDNINSTEIFDVNGRLLETILSNEKKINVSSLSKGVYLIKAHTDKKVITAKIIKE
ncbi:T9SS type A sorting domain-containing protein [Flavobacterium phycosphaerae]|uniref:T9SS type A sorting domain-containing protein n=1 Tax=Flavobacterium phycosphaerae TaxID=2697515 RepID=UPI001389A066|nr:T9SS type A sorting domain-containing protein [Flavobacterium phycosphaerae]